MVGWVSVKLGIRNMPGTKVSSSNLILVLTRELHNRVPLSLIKALPSANHVLEVSPMLHAALTMAFPEKPDSLKTTDKSHLAVK